MDNMTALVSAFARAYHYENEEVRVYADPLARAMLSDEEYAEIAASMSCGIAYFAPGFAGTQEEALRHIVNSQLAPSVLARSAFAERALANAFRIGCSQLVVFAVGYDTLSLRTSGKRLSVFELDRTEVIEDRSRRIERVGITPNCCVKSIGCDLSLSLWMRDLVQAGFDQRLPTFGTLLGISYYLTKDEFAGLVASIASLWHTGSSICFDYPVGLGGDEARRTRELAKAAGERMRSQYTYTELEELLADAGFLIFEHLDAAQATAQLFQAYDDHVEGRRMVAPNGVAYCLAVRAR